MSDEQSRAREESLGRAFAGALRVECGPVDVEAARLAYQGAGFDVTKHHPEGLDLQDCPVCGYESCSSDHQDDHGMGIGVDGLGTLSALYRRHTVR